MKPKLTEVAKGKWPGILAAIGVNKDHLTGRHGPCPMCAGKDRFRFDNKGGRGTYYCTNCGSGDGVELVKKFLNVEFKEAAREIEKHIGAAPVIAIRQGRNPEEVKREMNDIWRGAKPLGELAATALWWSARIGQMPRTSELRASRSLFCPGQGQHPGMLAMVRDPDGKPVNLHRTFLTPEGHKAQIPEPRRVMDAPMPKGSAVRLSEPTEALGIAEGIETAEACRLLFGVPVWAALNAENMTGWKPPEGVRRVIVFGDNDESLTGHWAAYSLAMKLRRAKLYESVEVHIPDRIGQDWNDVLVEKLSSGKAA